MKERLLAVIGVLALVGGGCLVAAPPASADQTWYQAIGRPSADAPCPATSAEDTKAGWSEWMPSWEQWPNNGDGGYVCTRSNTWAFESIDGAIPGAFCVQGSGAGGGEYLDFGGGWHLSSGSTVYSDASCLTLRGPSNWDLVYTTGGPQAAKDLCTLAFGGWTGATPMNWGYDVYGCDV